MAFAGCRAMATADRYPIGQPLRMTMNKPPFSFTLVDDYRVFPQPRWGYGRPSHPKIHAALDMHRAAYQACLDALQSHRAVLHGIPHDPVPTDPLAPCWNNAWFSILDAASLVGMLLTRKPRRYIEIGSGNSTMFARRAIRAGGLPTTISSIDPRPRAHIDRLCERFLRVPLETCALEIFDELEAGDILFFDGSHRVFQNSDVTAFFLDVMPRLKAGVIVHLHDVFLPDDYPPSWAGMLFSEQYLLAAMLLSGAPPFRVLLPNYFVCADPVLAERVRAIFQSEGPNPDIPFTYRNHGNTPACSFWIEMERA
jgi:hypothetical protein